MIRQAYSNQKTPAASYMCHASTPHHLLVHHGAAADCSGACTKLGLGSMYGRVCAGPGPRFMQHWLLL